MMEVHTQEIDWFNLQCRILWIEVKTWMKIHFTLILAPTQVPSRIPPVLGLMMKILLYASDVIRILTFMHTISYSEWRFITSVMINTKRQYCQYPILFRGNGNDGTSYWYLYILCHIRKCIILFAIYFHMAYFN